MALIKHGQPALALICALGVTDTKQVRRVALMEDLQAVRNRRAV